MLDAYRRSDSCYRVDSEMVQRLDGVDGFAAWVVLRRDHEHVTYWLCLRHRSASCEDVQAVRNVRAALGLDRDKD